MKRLLAFLRRWQCARDWHNSHDAVEYEDGLFLHHWTDYTCRHCGRKFQL